MASWWPGLRTRLRLLINIIRFTLLQNLQRSIISIRRSRFFSPTTQPDLLKIIARRRDLYASRVFLSKAKDARSSPIIVMVHGGGWVMNNPAADDPLARFLADTLDCNVISIDYRKVPRHPFPAAYEDVVQAVAALLVDELDDLLAPGPRKIVLCGSSAGGNLVLAAAQDERLRGRLVGICAIYPVINFEPSIDVQMARRPDPSVPDFLDGGAWDNILDLYVGSRDVAVLRDPRLSPINFRRRDDLPRNIFLIGCEHDALCYEAKMMAEKLVVGAAGSRGLLDDGWQEDGVRWKLVKGHAHAFDHFPQKAREKEEMRVRDKDLMYQDIAKWMFETIYASYNSK